MTQLLQTIQPLLAGAGISSPVAAAAPQPVIFVLSQETTNPDQLIDFSTHKGQALFNAGGAKLDDALERFYVKVSKVVRFQEMLQSRSQVME